MKGVEVSIITSTVSRARLSDFNDLLIALTRQDCDEFELIVIVDEDRDHLRDVEDLVKDCSYPTTVFFNDDNRGLAHSRNLGVGLAKGRALAFIDDDAEPYPQWVRMIKSTLSDPSIGAVTGDIDPKWMQKGMDWFPKELFWMISCSYNVTPMVRGEIDRGFGVDMAFSREAIDAVGHFDTRFGIKKGRWIGGEDTEMFIRIRSAGFRVIYEPEMKVQHHIHPDRLRMDKMMKRAVAQGRGTVIMKHGMKERVSDQSGKTYALDILFRFVPEKIMGMFSKRFFKNIRDLGLVMTINMLIVVGYALEIISPTDDS